MPTGSAAELVVQLREDEASHAFVLLQIDEQLAELVGAVQAVEAPNFPGTLIAGQFQNPCELSSDGHWECRHGGRQPAVHLLHVHRTSSNGRRDPAPGDGTTGALEVSEVGSTIEPTWRITA